MDVWNHPSTQEAGPAEVRRLIINDQPVEMAEDIYLPTHHVAGICVWMPIFGFDYRFLWELGIGVSGHTYTGLLE